MIQGPYTYTTLISILCRYSYSFAAVYNKTCFYSMFVCVREKNKSIIFYNYIHVHNMNVNELFIRSSSKYGLDRTDGPSARTGPCKFTGIKYGLTYCSVKVCETTRMFGNHKGMEVTKPLRRAWEQDQNIRRTHLRPDRHQCNSSVSRSRKDICELPICRLSVPQ